MREIALNSLYKTIGYTFKSTALVEQALTHRSFERYSNNERLEFLGDSILGVVITEALFKRFPQCTEGELTRLRSSLVKGETLAKVGSSMGLGAVLNLGLSELSTGGFRRHSTIEDAFEALIAALYLDSDFATIKTLILKWFAPLLEDLNTTNIPHDYKSRLQEELQAKDLPLPTYQVLQEEGPDHAKIFFVRCSVPALSLSTEGKAQTKKAAEQDAAQQILNLLINTKHTF